MKPNSDPVFNQYANTDFSAALPVSDIPALAALQAKTGGKSRITMRVDNTTLAIFKLPAEKTGGNYQSLLNEALAQFAQGHRLADVVGGRFGRNCGVRSGNATSGKALYQMPVG